MKSYLTPNLIQAKSATKKILYDKEKLFDDKQKLKKVVNNLKEENLKLKSKVQLLLMESTKYENLFQN